MIGESASGRPVDFYVSHAGTDEDWATWIAQQLEDAGYTVELDVWNWAAGIDVIDATQRALDRADRVLAVWTPEYFIRTWAQLEHRVSFAAAQAQPGWLVPIVVRSCPDEAIPRLYRTLIRAELVGLSEPAARARLLEAVAGPSRPTRPLPYPGAAGSSYPGRLPRVWNVTNRNPFFVGRESLLDQLHARLSAARPAAVVLAAELSEGGLGKSDLAIEYAWRYADRFELVWWVDASSHATGAAGLLELAVLLDVPTAGGSQTALPALFAELAGRADWLLVLDDVAGPEQFDRLRPPESGRLIVTTRHARVGQPGQRIPVGRFNRAESMGLLRRRCPWLAQPAAARIAEILDDLPLAVAQAAAFLAQTGMAVEEYLPRLVGHGAVADDGPASLAATVVVTLDQLAALDPAATDLLDQLALLAPEPVPLTAAAPAAPDAAPVPGLVVSDPETTSEIVSSITGLGLATLDGTSIQLHSRVHAVIAASLSGERRALALGRALRLLGTADPGEPGWPRSWLRYAALASHVDAAAAALAITPGVPEAATFLRLLDHVCRYLRLAGQPQASYDLAEATYQRRHRAHGPDHPQTLRWAMHRGAGLAALGCPEDAREVLADALDRQRQLTGPDHPQALQMAGHLAGALAALRETESAQQLLLDTLARRRRTLGPDAAETLESATDLGELLRVLGYHQQSRHLLEEALTRRRRVLGADHPQTLASAHHLGLTLAVVGDHDAARNVLWETAGRRRRVFGADHPEALASAHHLGLVLAAVGDHDAARDVLRETAGRRRRVLGADHREALASAHHLGLVLAAVGEHDAARQVLDDTWDRRQRVLGPDHPDTLSTEASRRGPWPPVRPAQPDHPELGD
ncbi:MAG TPA: toll/interleukin-1 receptor domain-containing protein [Mycobacteriales bacterium]|nr:toll/interleukin-1 receptor domain-containing protein [Mycobacteriales bacterium]